MCFPSDQQNHEISNLNIRSVFYLHMVLCPEMNDNFKKVQVGKDQEKAQSEKDSTLKTEMGKN